MANEKEKTMPDKATNGVPAHIRARMEAREEMVDVKLFKDNDKYKDDVFVAINGQSYQIRRGETVQVPRKVADVLEASYAQDMRTAALIDQKSAEFATETKLRGI